MKKVVYLDSNYVSKRHPNGIKDGDKFYTYGFASIYARKFKLYNSDFEVECWKTDPRIDKIYQKEIEGVKYIVFPSINIKKLGHFSKSLIKKLKEENSVDNKIIYNISSMRHLLFYSVAYNLKNNPLVIQNHGEATAYFKNKINRGLKKLFYLAQVPIEKRVFKNVDIFFILDNDLIEYIPKSNRNIKIIKSTTGVDENIFKSIDKTEAKKILDWDTSKKHILYVGRLNYTKRTDLLISIHKEFQLNGRKDIEIVFAGTEKDDILYKEAEKAGIRIYPKILMTELYKYLSAADVYVLPDYADDMKFLGIGMLPVQAMLCNTPVVGYSLKNYVDKIENIGVLAKDKQSIKDAIIKIIDKKINFNNLRETAISFYSWKNVSERTRKKYDNLILKYSK